MSLDQQLRQSKALLRKQIKRQLSEIRPQQRQNASLQAQALACQLSWYQPSKVIMVFLSMPTEIDTAPLIRKCFADNKIVCAPRVDWQSRQIRPVGLASLDSGLAEARYGCLEPVDGPILAVEDIDLVIVPGLAFDLRGNRLGRGAGFYDRFLAQEACSARTVGYGYHLQVVPCVPCGPDDTPIDAIVTEKLGQKTQ